MSDIDFRFFPEALKTYFSLRQRRRGKWDHQCFSGPSCHCAGTLRLGRMHYRGLVHAPFIYLLEELVIVAIVNMHADKHGAWSIKCLLEHRGDLPPETGS